MPKERFSKNSMRSNVNSSNPAQASALCPLSRGVIGAVMLSSNALAKEPSFSSVRAMPQANLWPPYFRRNGDRDATVW